MKSDIVLGNDLRLLGDQTNIESPRTEFKPNANAPEAASVVINSDGSALLTVKASVSTTHPSGIEVHDLQNNPIISMGTETISKADLTKTRIHLDGKEGNVILGGYGKDGDLVLRNHQGKVTAHITATAGRDSNTVNFDRITEAKLRVNAETGQFDLGGILGGTLRLRDNKNKVTMELQGRTGRAKFEEISLGSGNDKIDNLHDFLLQLRADVDTLLARNK